MGIKERFLAALYDDGRVARLVIASDRETTLRLQLFDGEGRAVTVCGADNGTVEVKPGQAVTINLLEE